MRFVFMPYHDSWEQKYGVPYRHKEFFLRWHLILVGFQCGICLISPFWCPEFSGGFYNFEIFGHYYHQ